MDHLEQSYMQLHAATYIFRNIWSSAIELDYLTLTTSLLFFILSMGCLYVDHAMSTWLRCIRIKIPVHFTLSSRYALSKYSLTLCSIKKYSFDASLPHVRHASHSLYNWMSFISMQVSAFRKNFYNSESHLHFCDNCTLEQSDAS